MSVVKTYELHSSYYYLIIILQEPFSTLQPYDDGLTELQRSMRSVSGQRRKENMEAYTREVSGYQYADEL